MKSLKELCSLPVIQNRPGIQHYGENKNDEKLMLNIVKAASFQHYHSHYFNKVFQRINCGNPLRPLGHAFYRREKSAQ